MLSLTTKIRQHSLGPTLWMVRMCSHMFLLRDYGCIHPISVSKLELFLFRECSLTKQRSSCQSNNVQLSDFFAFHSWDFWAVWRCLPIYGSSPGVSGKGVGKPTLSAQTLALNNVFPFSSSSFQKKKKQQQKKKVIWGKRTTSNFLIFSIVQERLCVVRCTRVLLV